MNPVTGPRLGGARADATVERPLVFPLAVVLRACIETLEAIGWRHRRRIPIALLAFLVPFFYLGLPEKWMQAQSLEQLLYYGRWGLAAQLVLSLELGGLLLFKLITLVPRMARERRLVGVVRLQDLHADGEVLFHAEVRSSLEFAGWQDRLQHWFLEVEQELQTHFPPQAVKAFHSVPVGNLTRYRHGFDEEHDGWLNLLDRRLQVLRWLAENPDAADTPDVPPLDESPRRPSE
jgi:hypothetical protein